MNYRTLISCILLSTLVLLLLSTAAQAVEYREVNKEIKAEEILNHIKNGDDINITNCRIVGELNLNTIELKTVPNPRYQEISEWSRRVTSVEDRTSAEENMTSIGGGISAFTGCDNEGWVFESIDIWPEVNRELKVVESNITIDNCVFEDNLDFSYTLFKKPLSFIGVNYSSNAIFRGSYFYSSTCFDEDIFSDSEDFSFTTFNDSTSFNFATFNNSAEFFLVTFNGDAYFSGTIFNNATHFLSATFKGAAGFCQATFKGAADFSNATFNIIVYFGEATFKDIVFQNTTFENISFSCTTFKGAAGFDKASFKNVDFPWDTDFKGDVDFSGATFEHVTDLSFASFNDTAEFTGPDTPENIILNGENSQIFINSYKSQGRYDDADTIYYNYRKEAQAQKEWDDLSKWMDIICWITCGYGVRPLHTLYLGGTLIVLFSVIYAKGPAICFYTDHYGVKSFLFYLQGPGITKRKEDSENQPQEVSFINALYFSVNTFTTVGDTKWYPKENFKKWATLEGLLGWVLLGIFMASLSTVMIRV